MAKNINNNSTNNVQNKEEKKMTRRERFEALKAQTTNAILNGSNKTGYGIGYVTGTTKYYLDQAKSAITGTKIVTEFSNGYADGKNDAYYDCAIRERERQLNSDAKKANKAAKAAMKAAEELMAEFEG